MKILLSCLILILSIELINSQISTAPTPDPTTTTEEITTITTITVPTAPTIKTTTTPILTTLSPVICPPLGIHHLPSENCQEFIVCVYGRPHMGACSEGTLFDTLTSSCLPANQVDCGTRYRP